MRVIAYGELTEAGLVAIEARARAEECHPGETLTLVAEARRLRAENAELVALLGDRVLDSDLASKAVRLERESLLRFVRFVQGQEKQASSPNKHSTAWQAYQRVIDNVLARGDHGVR